MHQVRHLHNRTDPPTCARINSPASALEALRCTLHPTDPETFFRFHLTGLFSVMNDLTKKTQSLTVKYMDIIGVAY